jgi:hypothetical protein
MINQFAPEAIEMVKGSFSMFSCTLDEDIQDFIHNQAFEFQQRGWSSVYLLFDKEKFMEGVLSLEAYFTLSHKAILLSEAISKTQKKKIFGGVSNLSECAHFVLIGHLGKHISEERRSPIKSADILDSAFEIIKTAKDLITFNCVLVECKKIENLLKIYEGYGFKYLQDDGLTQLIKRI